ncbi:GNAT family N-acetyltransferase [Kocuria sp. CPCC 205261]|uniref:GNAT family N-acetyltransferase n=1 Tax=Kocuria sp. CPCC 205261 TaxID=3073554 RepID=UPI0034D77ECE
MRRILEALPEWFGIPEAIDGYAADAADDSYGRPMALDDGAPVGVVLTRRHFPESAEIHLMAVHPDVRGTGIGRRLVERVVDDLSADGCTLLSVHPVGPSFANAPYAQTRAFYTRMVFLPLEEHEDLEWPGPRSSWSGPCPRQAEATLRTRTTPRGHQHHQPTGQAALVRARCRGIDGAHEASVWGGAQGSAHAPTRIPSGVKAPHHGEKLR